MKKNVIIVASLILAVAIAGVLLVLLTDKPNGNNNVNPSHNIEDYDNYAEDIFWD